MRARQISDILEKFAPIGTAEEWDNPGYCIGSPDKEVRGVLVAFDCTADVVEEAAAKGCDMIVTHHPLIFHGVKKIRTDDPVGKAIDAAIRHGITVYAAHTNADKAPEGVNRLMAKRLRLQDAVPFDESGIGLVGKLPIALDCPQFIEQVMADFRLEHIRYSKPTACKIERVALCSGSGGSLLESALSSGAQAYVTADISYHEFFCPDGFIVLDIGHFESEVEIVDKFIEVLKENLHTFAVRKAETIINPINYR
jgi:dinuclear metal center YbgI/SA1388 family protein